MQSLLTVPADSEGLYYQKLLYENYSSIGLSNVNGFCGFFLIVLITMSEGLWFLSSLYLWWEFLGKLSHSVVLLL